MGFASAQAREPTTFIIDETFGVPGVGTVVAGTLKGGVITTGASLLLGPDLADGSFKPTAIKSIAYKRLPVNKVPCPSYPRSVHRVLHLIGSSHCI